MTSGAARSQSEADVGSSDACTGELSRWLLTQCPPDVLTGLLTTAPEELAKAAVVALGARGNLEHCPLLLELLHRGSDQIVALAEDSLWRLWMRGGSASAVATLSSAIKLMQANRLKDALGLLDRLTLAEPNFAEPHNQRGIALCLLDRLDEAADAFREALRHNRYHFSAAVSLGHTYAQRGQLRSALRHYRRALQINPRLDGVHEIVERLEAMVGDGSVSSR